MVLQGNNGLPKTLETTRGADWYLELFLDFLSHLCSSKFAIWRKGRTLRLNGMWKSFLILVDSGLLLGLAIREADVGQLSVSLVLGCV